MSEYFSHVYLDRGSIRDATATAIVQAAMTPILEDLYKRGAILGYRQFLLEDREAGEAEIPHRDPFVYASVTPLDTDASKVAVDPRMAEHGFERFV